MQFKNRKKGLNYYRNNAFQRKWHKILQSLQLSDFSFEVLFQPAIYTNDISVHFHVNSFNLVFHGPILYFAHIFFRKLL